MCVFVYYGLRVCGQKYIVTVCEKVVPRLNKHDGVIEWNFKKLAPPEMKSWLRPCHWPPYSLQVGASYCGKTSPDLSLNQCHHNLGVVINLHVPNIHYIIESRSALRKRLPDPAVRHPGLDVCVGTIGFSRRKLQKFGDSWSNESLGQAYLCKSLCWKKVFIIHSEMLQLTCSRKLLSVRGKNFDTKQ